MAKKKQIDLVDTLDSDKKTLTIEEKRARNREYQRKYREKRADRLVSDENGKAKILEQEISRLQAYLKPDTMFRLYSLARRSGLTKTEVLERLINGEYDNMLNDKETVLGLIL